MRLDNSGYGVKGMKGEEFTWECDECFATWEDEESQMVCPVCGSTFVYKVE
jgi:rubrerythrin